MKKLTLFLAVIFIAATTFGQTKTDAKKDQKATVKTEQAKPAAKTEQAKPATTPAAPAAAATAAPLKKDGTPDKRFKENKETPKPAGPVKKDGTPDMRYKSNKEAAPVKK